MKSIRLITIAMFAVWGYLMLSGTTPSDAQEIPTDFPTLHELGDLTSDSSQVRAGWDLDVNLVVTQTDGSTIATSFGAPDTITVALAAQPAAPVTLVHVLPLDFISLPRKVVFTPENWNIPQTITVYALHSYSGAAAVRLSGSQQIYGAESTDENGVYSYKPDMDFGIPIIITGTPVTAPAGPLVVTTLADSVSEVIPGSLRQMIHIANARAGADTITFQAGLTGTITLAGSLPMFDDALTLTGPGQTSLIIDGAGMHDGFTSSHISSDDERYHLTVENLTLANLYYAIHVPYVSLTDVTVRNSGNGASFLWGYPAVVGYEKTTLNRVTMRENSGLIGGALVAGEVDITDSTFVDNQAYSLKNSAGQVSSIGGGAIYLEGGQINASWIRRSTFVGNIAPTGGAIFTVNVPITILHSTFSANIASLEEGVAALTT